FAPVEPPRALRAPEPGTPSLSEEIDSTPAASPRGERDRVERAPEAVAMRNAPLPPTVNRDEPPPASVKADPPAMPAGVERPSTRTMRTPALNGGGSTRPDDRRMLADALPNDQAGLPEETAHSVPVDRAAPDRSTQLPRGDV